LLERLAGHYIERCSPHALQVRGMRPLGNGVRATAAMAATPVPLQLLTPGGIPAPPASAAELLADCGIAGIRQTWQRPGQRASQQGVTPGSASGRHQSTGTRQVVDNGGGAGALQAGAGELYSQARPLKLLTPSPLAEPRAAQPGRQDAGEVRIPCHGC
jgi:hypothetical protein